MDVVTFSWLDYTLFILTLLFSVVIGIYYGYFHNQSSADEYLLGGKRMTMWPVALSLVSSTVSGLTVITVPVDIYNYGICYWLGIPSFALVLFIVHKVYLPVFYKLQITSTYEYLQLRFNNNIRILASVLFTIYNFFYLPIVVYAPALALSEVTGSANIHLITFTMCAICILYTTIGGFKAVIWTDAFQFFIMMGSIVIVFILGLISVGGPQVIWNLAHETGRLDIGFNFDLTERDSFWTGTIGASTMWIMVAGISQGSVQKYLSLPSYGQIKIALVLYFIGISILVSICTFSGLLLFAKYYGCDPLLSEQIKKADHLLPHYVLEVAKVIPGLSGLFISGVFSAALSTLSASMNCLAATIYEDFVSHFMDKNITQQRISKILKLLVVCIGIVCTLMVFVVSKMGNLLPLAFSFSGITSGALLGLFTIGMLLPMVNSKGALYGGITSLVIMSWIIGTAQFYKNQNKIIYPTYPVFVDQCNSTINVTNSFQPDLSDVPPAIYWISHYYYAPIGFLIILIVSIVVSYIFKDDNPVNEDCISPVSKWLIPKNNSPPPEYNTIEKASEILTINKE